MGSWATGAMLAAGAASDMLTGLGNLVMAGLNYQNQVRVQQQQLALARDQLALLDKTSNPVTIFQNALGEGFDPVSARQLAGSHEMRYMGATPLPPLYNREFLALTGTRVGPQMLAANSAFVNGVPRTTPPRTPLPGFANLNYSGLRQPGSDTSSLSSFTTVSPYSTVSSFSSTLSKWSSSTSSVASTVPYSQLPGKH
uniref:ORF2 protein n=1 Tax=Rousettus bat calicivirus TaxID=3141901 RepID=A0AAU7E245_9CALI